MPKHKRVSTNVDVNQISMNNSSSAAPVKQVKRKLNPTLLKEILIQTLRDEILSLRSELITELRLSHTSLISNINALTTKVQDMEATVTDMSQRLITFEGPCAKLSSKNKYLKGSPDKILKLHTADGGGDRFENEDQVDLVKMDMAEQEDQEMNSEDEIDNCEADINTKPLMKAVDAPKILQIGNVKKEDLFLTKQRSTWKQSPKTETSKVIKGQDKIHVAQTLSKDLFKENSSSVSIKPLENRNNILTARSSIREYQKTMEEKARGDITGGFQDSHRHVYTREHLMPIQQTYKRQTEKLPLHSKTELGREKNVKRKASLTSSTTGHEWSLCGWLKYILLLLAPLALGLIGYQHFPCGSFYNGATENHNTTLSSQHLKEYLVELAATSFPSQREELWKRTGIHLMRHLKMTNPTEPVSLILTSGRSAEKTLRCLAQELAAAFSTALNSSVLNIDGSSKSSQDSDQVKKDIDDELKEAFDGETQAAVIHRFEELPPGSTLIFYRYCDHETAAYKKVFLVFTVILPVEELASDVSLLSLEEMVQEHLNKKFVISDRTGTFNQMDVDKLSGLWSRISHLILPVMTEQVIEQNGCTR